MAPYIYINYRIIIIIIIISGFLEQDIVDRKTVLQNAITLSLAYALDKFGELWPTNSEKWDRCLDPLNQLFRTLISQKLRGVAPRNFSVCKE